MALFEPSIGVLRVLLCRVEARRLYVTGCSAEWRCVAGHLRRSVSDDTHRSVNNLLLIGGRCAITDVACYSIQHLALL